MADIVSSAVRSRMMSGIRGKNTQPELLIRRGLFALGYRYRIHSRSLPGKPDLVLAKHRIVVFVNGCFWHGHNCSLFKWPSSNVDFWREKITRNQELDRLNSLALKRKGWRILTVWECALKGPWRRPLENVLGDADEWTRSGAPSKKIQGKKTTTRAAKK
jgi:DNA mismatch endonuclease (patch repair protein)